MKYRVRLKLRADDEIKNDLESLNEALEMAAVYLDNWSTKDNRTGSLRGDGEVIMWENGERIGYVIVEEHRHGLYEKIGG